MMMINIFTVREQAGGGWSSVRTGTGGEQYVEEEVEVDGSAKDQGGGGSKAASSSSSSSTPAAAPSSGGSAAEATADGTGNGGGGQDGDKKQHSGGGGGKRKKKIRRRVEPLPEFASVAQTELGKLQAAFDQAQADYKGERTRSCTYITVCARVCLLYASDLILT